MAYVEGYMNQVLGDRNYQPKNEYGNIQGMQNDTKRGNWASSDLIGSTLGSGPKESPITMAVNNLEKDLAMLGESLNQLRNMIAPVMRSESPQPREDDKVEKAAADVPMVIMIAAVDSQVREFTRQVRNMVERVAL